MDKIVIYGAGGFGREIACLINAINLVEKRWDFIGFIDDGIPPEKSQRYGKVLGNIDYLNSYHQKLAVVISVSSPSVIANITGRIKNQNIWYPNLIAPDVKFHDAESFVAGKGNILFFSCRISCQVTIGDFNLLNSLVSLGHDVTVGDRNVFNPSVRISGDCTIGNGNFFGVHAIVMQGRCIGNDTRIGVSSVVMRNTSDGVLYFGNPAKRVNS